MSKRQIADRCRVGWTQTGFNQGRFRQAVAAALAIGAFSVPSAALGQFFPGYGYRPGNYGFGNGGYAPDGGYYIRQRAPSATGQDESDDRHAERHARRHPHRRSEEAKTAATKTSSPKIAGPLMIAVSIGSQRVTVYDNGVQVASAPISTGMKGHPTPLGVFSIIQKEKWHESNLYSNAPMPYMERITWSGVALHAGVLPGYPASHGCIRMPHDFAVRLYGMTRLGARVVVTRDDTSPFEINHPRLALLARKPPEASSPLSPSPPQGLEEKRLEELNRSDAEATPAGAAEHEGAAFPPDQGANPGEGAAAKESAPVLQAIGEAKPRPVEKFSVREAAVPPLAGAPNPLQPPLKTAEPAAAKPGEPPLRPGPISLFVSRKEGKLFVRKGFEPVFDMPVMIKNPGAPIGVHVFTAASVAEGADPVRWLAVSIPNSGDAEPQPARRKSRRLQAEPALPPAPTLLAAEALDRIELPPAALERIAPLMSAGASLVIADQGLGPETGKETDFIVLTR